MVLSLVGLAGRVTRLSAQDAAPGGASAGASRLEYPAARRAAQLDRYHGVEVSDPYRWLEDTDSEETRSWIEAQNKLTFSHLAAIPERPRIRQRLTELWNYERFGLPQRREHRYFYTRNDGLQDQSVLYVAEGRDGEPRVLLDPNQLSGDGTVALAGWEPSEDGRLLAYGLAAAGSDWREWKVMDVATGRDLPDRLEWIKFSGVSWRRDGSGFYYSRYDAPRAGEQFTGVNYYQKLYFHRLGDDQSQDELVYQRADEKEWGFDGRVTEDGRFLVITVWRGSEEKNQLFYRDLAHPDSPVVELIAGFDAQYEFVGNDGELFWIATDADAPLRRVVAVDVRRPDRTQWRVVVPEAADVLESVGMAGDYFLAAYLHDAASRVAVFDLQGGHVRNVELPGLGSVAGWHGRREDTEVFYAYTSFTAPGTIYRYDVRTGQSQVYREPKLAFDPNEFETKQVFVTSKDGTRVPMFLTYRRGLLREEMRPTLLYGYGGFNISLPPTFSVSNLVWMEMGGIAATVNLRGGGEYGRSWHEAGMRASKQNVFDDFLAAAEWLIRERYTEPDQLAIHGRSNGGLLVGAALTQRPDLFGAALPAVGVMDMLRYHQFTIGWAWVGEYGSSDAADQFRTLFAYSPLHRLKPGTRYPATLVTTADHDDRVVPGHSFKFAAAMQHAQAGEAPVLIRIETRAGHGMGTPTSKLIDTAADQLAFLVEALDVQDVRKSRD